MSPVKTEDFPYTAKYVRELLKLDEHALMAYVESLGIAPRVDELTGSLVFGHKDIELLRKAMDMTKRGEDLGTVAQQLGMQPANRKAPVKSKTAAKARALVAAANGSTVTTMSHSGMPGDAQGSNLAVIVETVSQAKESILKDLSRLLDDKLAGLDEVVVELIRCKSENDALKNKVESLQAEKAKLEKDLSSFKPVQFGFYRKVGG